MIDLKSNYVFIFIILSCILGLIYSFLKSRWILNQDQGNNEIKSIASSIQEGAMTFLKVEYRVLSIFVLVVSFLLGYLALNNNESSILISLSFIIGAFTSGLSGYIGMWIATHSNSRTSNAARKNLSSALKIAFTGGSVMGLSVVGLAVLGLSLLFLLYENIFTNDYNKILKILSGFSLGASSIALFARVGGGIYTKAADVGADLVGKVEENIPEDHPLNPATIADNVGDNVGDVAGMGADLFESFIGSIIGSMVLGATILYMGNFELSFVLLPLIIASSGIIASIIGALIVSWMTNSVKLNKSQGKKFDDINNPHKSLNTGIMTSSFIMALFLFFEIKYLLPNSFELNGVSYSSFGIFVAALIGLFAGLGIGFITEFYTGMNTPSTKKIASQSVTGAATNVISGLGIGMQSTAVPILIIASSIILAFHFAGLYGIAIAALGMLANTGIQLAIDAYGPISDNAGGIAQMSGLPDEVRKRTDKLDAVGNTTAAIGKGFAIGSAALTALALFAAFMVQTEINTIDISKPTVMAGLFVGGMLPFLFSALAMNAVGNAAMSMIKEVRRQFNEIPELKFALKLFSKGNISSWNEKDKAVYYLGIKRAEYGKCVEISTNAAIKEMILPSLLAIASPIIIGFIFGPETLGGLLAGVTVTGVLLAIFQSNSGGAWDNAKKMIEDGIDLDGKKFSKGSEAHKASVVGDTVGDPFKDTSGPSINILIKLMSVVSLVIAPFIS
tara:strand:+ start:237 stop:2432 length:2196 start_codon:yes stop_codon:yes gene_type:complete